MVAGSFYFPYLVYKRYGFEIKPLLKILNETQYRDSEQDLDAKVGVINLKFDLFEQLLDIFHIMISTMHLVLRRL